MKVKPDLRQGFPAICLCYPAFMTGNPRIVPLESGQLESGQVESCTSGDDGILELETALEETSTRIAPVAGSSVPRTAWPEPEDDAPTPSRWLGTAAPLSAAALVFAWTAFFAWANLSAIRAGAAPAQWAEWLVAWSVPVLLVMTGLLLALRTSRREAGRFTDVARALGEESARLEARLVTVNGELSLAREFVAAQSRDLESLGRIATERLSHNAEKLAALIQDNSAQIEAIGTVSASALENMDKLRGQLPVIANSAKDVTNNIGSAGRTAHAQLQDMVTGFHRLNEFGQASERQVATMRDGVNATVEEFTRQADLLGEIASQRFAALADEGIQFRASLDDDEVAALASIRTRAAALAEENARLRASLDDEEAAALTAIRTRATTLADEGARLRATLDDEEAAALAAIRIRATTLAEELGAARAQFAGHENAAHEALAARLALLRDEAARASTTLRQGEAGAMEALRGGLAALSGEAHAVWTELDRLDGAAIASATTRLADLTASADALHASIAARSTELSEDIWARRAELETAGRSAVEGQRSRLGEIDAAIKAQRERHLAQSRELVEHSDRIGERLGLFTETMGTLGAHGDEVAAKLDSGLALLAERLTASRAAMAGTDGAIAALTDDSVRLLELIQASAAHTREALPQALAGAEDRLKGIETSVVTLRDALGEAGTSGQALSDYVIATRAGLGEAAGQLTALHSGLEDAAHGHRAQVAAIREEIAAARGESEALAGQVQDTLQAAIDRLAAAARETASGIASDSEATLDAVAARLGEKSAAAIETAMAGQSFLVVGRLEAAVAAAATAAREAAIQMRDQLARVDELAGNLERRVEHARNRAEEHIDDDFARRVAVITESLNSAAIDIAKALSSDVTDTAWASYLRGDRGIFTRRAVALLDGSQVRAVAQHYEADRDFRENVNHYIHDFEAMLRNLLSTRDGNALGVTLLSSDMGKLYVALAQGIERLRGVVSFRYTLSHVFPPPSGGGYETWLRSGLAGVGGGAPRSRAQTTPTQLR